MVNYYSLEEAARLLGTSPDELRKMADRNEIRAFRDRGNMRFRTQDIEERARQLGRGSDPELQPGDVVRSRPGDSPVPRKGGAEVFDFELGAEEADVDLGSLTRADQPSSRKSGSGRRGGKGPASPAPAKTGSDSDVRLVPDGSNVDFVISPDSDVKMVQEPPPPRKSQVKRKGDAQEDSGVRIVPLDSDSDVKVTPDSADEGVVSLGSPGPRSASDSDIRLHQEPGGASPRPKRKSKAEPPVTEEIDLDAELTQAGSGPPPGGPRKSKLKPGQQPNLPTSSPFELSDTELKAAQPGSKKGKTDSSSDFDLTPMSATGQSPLDMDSDEVSLGQLRGSKSGDSGINLQDPADSGISLEQGGGEDLEMELNPAGLTPAPAKADDDDSSGEFELSLDSGNTPSPKAGKKKPAPAAEESDSEFELSMDAEGGPASDEESDSDSEFELTLDAGGGLAPLEDEEGSTEERDIFETDFEVPALDEESGSQAMALDEPDTELESEDFDLDQALDEEDIEAEDESHSAVVAIEDEDEEAAAAPRRRRPRSDDELEAEEEERPAAAGVAAPAQWGVLPAVVLFPCVIVMFLASLMAFELLRGMWGYHQNTKVGGLIVRPMAETFSGEDLPK